MIAALTWPTAVFSIAVVYAFVILIVSAMWAGRGKDQ
jgi:hypothetical protein